MELNVTLKRVYKDEYGNILVTHLDINGENFYCLSDILEQINLKEK